MKLPCILNGKTIPLQRIEKRIERQDLLAWLESQSLYPKVFWKEKGSLTTRAAVGSLLMFPSIPSVEGQVRLYGGSSFAEPNGKHSVWEGFPRSCFWLPQIEISQTDGETVAVFYSFEEVPPPLETVRDEKHLYCTRLGFVNLDSAKQSKIEENFVRALNEEPHCQIGKGDEEDRFCEVAASPNSQNLSGRSIPPSAPMSRQDLPLFAEWEKALSLTLDAIASKQIEKLVLARQTTWTFATPLSLYPLLVTLQNTQKEATLFAFQLSSHHCFFGATPELLFERSGSSLRTEAIAGTRPRGKTQEEEKRFALELLHGAKEQREFQVVKQGLEETLTPLVTRLKWEGRDEIIKTSQLQHLYNRLTAEILPGISDETVRQALHPTPALGGYPKEKALSLLKELESFDRGWYGAPVGVISLERTALYVAIRSCLLQECQLHQFAGAGIVERSVAELEWEELNSKMRSVFSMTLSGHLQSLSRLTLQI